MKRRSFVTLVVLLVSVASGRAQDVLTIGSGSAPGGGVISVPVSVRDVSGTPLGSDAGAGNRIQGVAFKVTFPTDLVASVTFARAGVIAGGTSLYETTLQGSGFRSFIVSFRESSNPIAFTLNAAAPGNQIGTLTVTLLPQAVPGSTARLTLDPPSATLSNQAGSIRETVANGNLALVNGSVTVSGTLPAPIGLVATAISTSQVNVTWSAVANADHYEVSRNFNGGAFTMVGSRTGTSLSDSTVAAGITYLYRVQAFGTIAANSGFSSMDPATTILFTDDPLTAGTIVKVIHMSQLRTAVNAMRASVLFPSLAPDATVAAGAVVRAQHVNDLRTGVATARSEMIGVPAMTFTDTLTPGATPVKALHVQELRNSVK